MEILLPVAALASLYFINKNDRRSSTEGFTLPNTDIPDRNYPEYEFESEKVLDQTSKLSVQNKTDVNHVYTDTFFKKDINSAYTNITGPGPEKATKINESVTYKPLSDVTYKSLSGQDVSMDYFQHNNMTPFFGSKIRTPHKEHTANESLLDSYSGSGSQIFNKSETAPLFAPENNTQWAFGMPNSSDFMQSRVNPVLKQSNVKPFEEIRVAPGIGLGYTSEGAGGFNNGVQGRDLWRDKTVDELRTANKPKSSGLGLLGHEGPPNHHVQYRGEQGLQEKHGPPKAFENTPDRYLKTTGATKQSNLIPVHVLKDVSRPDTTVSYAGGADYVNTGNYIPGEYHPSFSTEMGQGQYNPASAIRQGFTVEDNQTPTKNANNRTKDSKQGEYFGSVRGYVNEAMAPLLDILKPSRKENTMSNTRTYQNPKTAVGLPYANNNEKAKITIRQSTDQVSWKTIGAPAVGQAYAENTFQPSSNARQETGDYYYAGASQSNVKHLRNYDAEYAILNDGQKEKTINVAYTPSGNTSIFNNHFHMPTTEEREVLYQNSRDGVPTFPNLNISRDNMGISTIGDNSLYSSQHIDRMQDTKVSDQLKDNPYFIKSLSGGL